MKRWIAMLLALTALLCAGCSKEPAAPTENTTTAPSDTTAPSTEPTETTTEPTEPPTMANEFFDPEESKNLIDTWTTNVVLDGSILNFPDMESSITVKLRYQLNGDGTYVRGVEQKEFDTAIAAYESFVRDYMLAQRYASFVAEKNLEKKKKDQIAKEWEQTGWPQAQLEVDEFVTGLHLGYRFSTLNRSGDYYASKDVAVQDPAADAATEPVTTEDVLYFSMGDGTYEKCRYVLNTDGLTLLDTTDPNTFSQLNIDFPLTLTNKTAPAVDTETPTEEAEATETDE